MPESTLSVAVVTGAGGAHLAAYFAALRDTPECGEVVVFDPSGDCFAAARKILGEKLSAVFKDLDRALTVASPGMALVSVEAVQAPPLIDRLLRAGCHVLTEKPACVRAEDLAPLVDRAEEAKLHLFLALSNRGLPAVKKMKQLVEEGLLGELYGAEVHFAADQTRLTRESYQQSWFADRRRAGGGHLAWLGIHWLDLLTHVTGRRVTEVSGFAGLVGGQALRIEDSAAMTMRFDNGAFGTMISGYYLDKGYHSHLRLWGAGGWIEYGEHLGGVVKDPLRWYSAARPDEGVLSFTSPAEPRGYTPWTQRCVRACLGREEPPITGREGLQVLRTIYSFYEAAEKGIAVKVG